MWKKVGFLDYLKLFLVMFAEEFDINASKFIKNNSSCVKNKNNLDQEIQLYDQGQCHENPYFPSLRFLQHWNNIFLGQ